MQLEWNLELPACLYLHLPLLYIRRYFCFSSLPFARESAFAFLSVISKGSCFCLRRYTYLAVIRAQMRPFVSPVNAVLSKSLTGLYPRK
jgi:hypothetical protein